MAAECRIGVFGGTFDPPHVAHLDIARRVLATRRVDKVLLVPCLRHAFHKQPVSFEHRVEMCRRMVAEIDGVEVSDIERELVHPGRTLELLEALQRRHPSCGLRLIAGGDIYVEREKWFRFDLVERLAPPIYLARKGVPVRLDDWLEAPAAVSSSDLRQRLSAGETVAHLLCEPVRNYIVEHHLYGV